jgi:hypothetical protein
MVQRTLSQIADDTEDAPWMVMGTPQSNTTMDLGISLRTELRMRGDALFVAAMLPIWYYPIPGGEREQLAPDILVAPVEDRQRSSYQVAREGVPPSFVLEVVSLESRDRDLVLKPERYEVMGVQEYALFAPPQPDGRLLVTPQLRGFRLDSSTERYEEWQPDEWGRLYSEVLSLWLVVRDGQLRLQRSDASLVLTPEEAEAARRAAVSELTRLRAELDQRASD